MTPRLQRIFAAGAGTLPTDCVVDIGALTRWMYESAPSEVQDTWAAIVQAIGSSHRKFTWVAALPGDVSQAFGQVELDKAVQFLQSRGIGPIIYSSESVTSLLISTTRFTAAEVAVITADISTYPEQRLVLEHRLATLLDVATGAVHTDVTAYKIGDREAILTALVPAIIRPDPTTGKPPGGNAAWKFEYQLELALLGIEDKSLAPIPVYTLKSYWANLGRAQERELEIINANVDNVARATVERALPRSAPIVMATTTPPVVILATENENNGAFRTGKAGAIALVGTVKFKTENVFSIPRLLSDLVAANSKTWIVPRALDLLDYMAEQGIPLPEKVIDPAHCAFALCPDDIERAITACPSASALTDDQSRWLWDVKRKTNAPSSLESLANVLPNIVNELRHQTQMRGMDSLIDDDIAPTLPVLAAMERRGAWVALDRIDSAWSRLQREMTRLEHLFRPLLGSIDPYESPPKQLLRAIHRHGQVRVPSEYAIRNNDAKNDLQRLAHHYHPARALLEARTLSEIQAWLVRASKSGGRLRGRYFPEATGRWGMNAWHLQGMPKHSPSAKILRGLLEGPPGKVLLAADYSSFELRLVAGLSRDPTYLTAAQQDDAIGYLADVYFGEAPNPDKRARTKDYVHPLDYGISEDGFVEAQTSVPVADARDHYKQLCIDFGQLFAWRTQVTASLAGGAPVRTGGGWQRDPTLAKRGKQALQNAAVSTVVQGLAADILRWVLRRLNQVLPPTAELVFQNHDEVYVAASEEEVPQVSALLKRVLEQDILTSNLVPANIRLVAKIRTGRTWADLL